MKAFVIINKKTKIIMKENEKLLTYTDGFVAEDKMYELKGKGFNVEVGYVNLSIKK